MNFELNEKGGWIVPAGTKFAAGTVFPAYSEFGWKCTFAAGCKFDSGYYEFGWECEFGSDCKFGGGCKFGNYCKFGGGCKFDGYCKFGSCCKFSNNCKFGDYCEFDSYCKFGAFSKIGKGGTYAGREILQFVNMVNVDGSGRYITIMRHPPSDDGEITVTAGCFFGSLDKFCEKANSEGKPFYAKAITAVADAMLSS